MSGICVYPSPPCHTALLFLYLKKERLITQREKNRLLIRILSLTTSTIECWNPNSLTYYLTETDLDTGFFSDLGCTISYLPPPIPEQLGETAGLVSPGFLDVVRVTVLCLLTEVISDYRLRLSSRSPKSEPQ